MRNLRVSTNCLSQNARPLLPATVRAFLLYKIEELAPRNTLLRYPCRKLEICPRPLFPAKTTSDKSAREGLPLRDKPKSDADSGTEGQRSGSTSSFWYKLYTVRTKKNVLACCITALGRRRAERDFLFYEKYRSSTWHSRVSSEFPNTR